jgi:hypothetical protein
MTPETFWLMYATGAVVLSLSHGLEMDYRIRRIPFFEVFFVGLLWPIFLLIGVWVAIEDRQIERRERDEWMKGGHR